MKKKWIIIGTAVLTMSLTGCGTNENAEGNENNREQQAQTSQNRPRALQTDRTDNRTLRVNERAEQHVERIKEVEDAHVIIADNNAYVAVRLANNSDNGNNNGQQTGTGNRQTGTMSTGNRQTGTMGAGGGNNNQNRTGNNGNGQTFMENGTVNQNGDNGIIDGKGDAGNGKNQALGNGNNNNTGNNVTNNGNTNNLGNTNGNGATNNTGTATRTNRYTSVSNTFEQKIADQVRKADNKIHRVYVSINPDLYNTMNTYADDIRADRDRDSLYRDFNNTITNFFGINKD